MSAVSIPPVPMREALHFLGWRGSPVEPELLANLQHLIDRTRGELMPCVVMQRFTFDAQGCLSGTTFRPKGNDVKQMLAACDEAVLMAATLGLQSERVLIRQQACSSADALLLDAVLSAAIEAVCDECEEQLRKEIEASGLYLTDRFSPGYGDMPLVQSGEICDVLQAQKKIGLTVSKSGIMIPRKSVSAIMGISKVEPQRRPKGCAVCDMRKTCSLGPRE